MGVLDIVVLRLMDYALETPQRREGQRRWEETGKADGEEYTWEEFFSSEYKRRIMAWLV